MRSSRPAGSKDWLPPVAIFIGALLLWEISVRAFEVPHYVLPGPLLI
ncbi:MAG: ABC-type nitrate/sulfonate/bicarbonate transport system permease component, partial [Alphaproteobacteria bacterium]